MHVDFSVCVCGGGGGGGGGGAGVSIFLTTVHFPDTGYHDQSMYIEVVGRG